MTSIPPLNTDPQEVAKFEKLASRWWDRNSEFKPLHDINPLRAGFIDSKVDVCELELLDVGCGGGILSEAMAQRGARVTGIDMGAAPLAVARLHLLESQLDIHYEQTTAEDFAGRHPGRFDVVTCLEMLEHVPDPEAVVRACYTLLKPGGHLFVSTINRNPKAWLLAVVGAEYVLGMLPRGTHDYRKFIKPSELAAWARHTQLELGELRGMTYNPITRQYKLGRDVDVNYLMHLTKAPVP
ncbi:MAG TPA: bifunctional 2-polyprenyl-6-hydroxyphenol methylase/3-demethylubiquinol 3-O-methyltransferase UbiG [Pseudomonadaceae bacterium]|nr:bifunctional 2-polyprenyl-6-hydroxyphenol methylase/3-demethylubiquinol 3-O-methyltransferase UbiG [Pseudomonadaceae bacterium]